MDVKGTLCIFADTMGPKPVMIPVRSESTTAQKPVQIPARSVSITSTRTSSDSSAGCSFDFHRADITSTTRQQSTKGATKRGVLQNSDESTSEVPSKKKKRNKSTEKNKSIVEPALFGETSKPSTTSKEKTAHLPLHLQKLSLLNPSHNYQRTNNTQPIF